MATLIVKKLNIRRATGLIGIDRRIERTDLPFDQNPASLSRTEQLFAAMPGDWTSTKAYVAEIDGRSCGYAMVRTRTDQYRWDVQVLGAGTRRLDPTDDVCIELWSALLDLIVGDGASNGVRRIFAQTPEASASYQSFRLAGFEGYSNQTLLGGTLDRAVSSPEGFRRMHPSDVWSVHQLYNRSIPPVVQFAEAVTSADWDLPRKSLRSHLPFKSNETHKFVIDAAQGVSAYCRISAGSGHTMASFLAGEESGEVLMQLVTASLRASGIPRNQPIQVAVPGYQHEYLERFYAAGLEPQQELTNMVKHTTVPLVVRPRLQPLPAINKGAQPASGFFIAQTQSGEITEAISVRPEEHSRSEHTTH